MVDAMLAGCAVVTTGSGTTEIRQLADLPLVPKRDSPVLARMLSMYVEDRKSLAEVALRGPKVGLRRVQPRANAWPLAGEITKALSRESLGCVHERRVEESTR